MHKVYIFILKYLLKKALNLFASLKSHLRFLSIYIFYLRLIDGDKRH